MYPKSFPFQFVARLILSLFIINNVAPTLQFAYADSTHYYVDAISGSDANDGLTPGSAWQTLGKVNSTSLLQGDTVSLMCSDNWAEGLNLNALAGSDGLPITIDSYGSCVSDTPTIESVNISGSVYIVIDGVDISSSSPGSLVSVASSDMVNIQNSSISGSSAICTDVNNSSGVTVTTNTITSCQYGMNITDSEATIVGNTLSGITNDAINISSPYLVNLTDNVISNVAESAILFGGSTNVLQNSISNVCTTGSTSCAAIRNNTLFSGSVISIISGNSIKDVGSGVTATENAGILISGANDVMIANNGVINAQYGIRVVDASNTTISDNSFFSSRINTLSVIQNNTGATSTNNFNGNTFHQRAPNYPYIEFRDEVPGTGLATGLMNLSGNIILPLYKPNTSFARTVKNGGNTEEYSKVNLNILDVGITKFEDFAFKPYVNTGSYATANVLTNGDFSANVSNWTLSSQSGAAPTLGHNITGSYSGGSATVTPQGGVPDRIWVTNDAIISLTAGQVYHVTGYAKSSAGNINLRAFFHAASDKNILYSDRIAETYASASGYAFSFYLTATNTTANARFTLETSNSDTSYEIDSVSVNRLSAHVLNTNTYEVLAYENPTNSDVLQSCPGGAQCFAYVNGSNTSVNWPITIPAYATNYVIWTNSTNIISTPTCTLNISDGTLPTGQPAYINWTVTGSTLNTLTYETNTGSVVETVSSSDSRTFIPSYDAVSTILLDLLNDVGPNTCSVQIITTNTSPNIYVSSITGSEDDSQINGTLSGIDLNPGDSVYFEKFTDPTYGILNLESSGSIQYYPYADYCGTDTFMFRASDQYGHYADPITQGIDVGCVNDAPFIVSDEASSAGNMVQVDILTNDTDIDSIYQVQTFSIASFTQPMSGSVIQNGDYLEYTPIGSFSGADTFSYRMQDQDGALSTNTGTVTIHVTFPNMPPVANNINSTINEDGVLAFTLSGSDINGDVLSFTAVTLPMSGGLNLQSDGTFTYTPTAHFNGIDSFEFIASDGVYDSNTGTVSITITSIPDAPVGVDDAYSLNQDTLLSIPVLSNDSDVDSPTLTISGVTTPSHGSVVINGNNIDYTPDFGYFGTDNFTYVIVDETSLVSNTVNVNLNVILTNNAPTANSSMYSLNEDSALSSIVTGSDIEMSTLTYFLDSTTVNGVLSLTATGGFLYTPGANFNGSDSFSFHVSDGVYTSTAATISITVNPVNDTPIANTDTFMTIENSVASNGHILSGSLSGGDIDGDTLSFASSLLPTHGLLTLTSTGYFSYTPALGYTGSDTFSFVVNDGTTNSVSAIVSITVTSNGVVSPLNHFNVSIPASTEPGAAFNLSLQAIDGIGSIMTTYTGSVLITSNDPSAIIVSGGNITFNPADSGVKSLTLGVILYMTGTVTLNVRDIITGSSGSTTINVGSSTPAPVISVSTGSSNFGPGGGTNIIPPVYDTSNTNSGTIPNNELILSSAPQDITPQFVFAGEGSELLNQLFLVNRILLPDGQFGTSPTYSGSQDMPLDYASKTFLESLSESNISELSDTVLLRTAFWDHVNRAYQNDNPNSQFERARVKLNSFEFTEDVRLQIVRDTLLRILDHRQRKYREMLDRNIMTYSASSKSDNSGDGSEDDSSLE